MSRPKVVRCAIYTRKSSEEGLEQDFNSLHAQREACEAYIKSQASEGWRCLPDRYDDGGYSGGSTDRPGLQRLLQAIEAGGLDVIVVYKIDRLTRSLADFARLAELFDARAVSFVSVTQQFNTTTSMGRLTLNMLLSFAQFEREITGERIRDKIAASKKKGMWMGGNVPIGYDVVDRRLIVNPADAETVRTIFRTYLEAGTVPALAQRLEAAGITTRPRLINGGQPAGNLTFRPGHLYQLLSNPLYIGRIRHKDQTYPGAHEGIIDLQTWEAVQAQLAANTQGPRKRRPRAAKEPSLLAGILVGADGSRFVASHATKAGRRYRYYVEQPPADRAGGPLRRVRRIPAPEIEGVVRQAVLGLLASQGQIVAALGTNLDARDAETATTAARRLHRDLQDDAGTDRMVRLRSLLRVVEFEEMGVRIGVDTGSLRSQLGLTVPADQPGAEGMHVIEVETRIQIRGVRMKLVVGDMPTRDGGEPDAALIRAVTRAHDWFERLITGRAPSTSAIAAADGVTPSYVSRILRLAFLAPDIVETILDQRQAFDLYTRRLSLDTEISPSWHGQRKAFGMG